jgi:hypothetical protein
LIKKQLADGRKQNPERRNMTNKQKNNARKNANSPLIRVPAEIKARLEAERAKLEELYSAGRVELPAGVDCENIPMWAVIAKALDELQAHRDRAKKCRKNGKEKQAAE